jgi:hypothetical protein
VLVKEEAEGAPPPCRQPQEQGGVLHSANCTSNWQRWQVFQQQKWQIKWEVGKWPGLGLGAGGPPTGAGAGAGCLTPCTYTYYTDCEFKSNSQ